MNQKKIFLKQIKDYNNTNNSLHTMINKSACVPVNTGTSNKERWR